jgi:hypothetical protein
MKLRIIPDPEPPLFTELLDVLLFVTVLALLCAAVWIATS